MHADYPLPRDYSKIVFVECRRFEENGAVNIVPCMVKFSDGQSVTIRGGEKAAVQQPAGEIAVYVVSQNAYPFTDAAVARPDWRSDELRFHAKGRETVLLLIEPASEGSTYIGGWTIRREGEGL